MKRYSFLLSLLLMSSFTLLGQPQSFEITGMAGADETPCSPDISADINGSWVRSATDANGCEANLDRDITDCGLCGHVCDSTNGTPECAAGACTINCDTGFADCDSDVTNGCEINVNTDTSNCGACSLVCNSTNGTPTCDSGACLITCNSSYADCDGDVTNGWSASAEGNYTITCTVSDNTGQVYTDSVSIIITSQDVFSLDITTEKQSVAPGEQVNLAGNRTGGVANFSYSWSALNEAGASSGTLAFATQNGIADDTTNHAFSDDDGNEQSPVISNRERAPGVLRAAVLGCQMLIHTQRLPVAALVSTN